MPFKIEMPVVGDIAIAMWFGSYNLGQRLHSRPAFAYSFHTAFADSGQSRVSLTELDVTGVPNYALMSSRLPVELQNAACDMHFSVCREL